MPDVYILFLEFGPQRRSDLGVELVPLVKRLFPGSAIVCKIIDNSLLCEPELEVEGAEVIAGNNSNREFSGWSMGLAGIKPREDDIICFCNDTFASNYGRQYLSWFDSAEVRQALSNGMAAGYVDERQDELRLFELTLKKWIRTSLFFISYRHLRKALPMGVPVSDDVLFSKVGPDLFLDSAPISKNLRAIINWWLIKKPLPTGIFNGGVWHSAAPLTEQNRNSMQQKAKSILAEMYLSARLQEANVDLFDVRVSKTRALGLFAILNRAGVLSSLRKFRHYLVSSLN